MYEPIESWATDPDATSTLVPIGQGLALAAVKYPSGWTFAWLLNGEPLPWPNPYAAGSEELS